MLKNAVISLKKINILLLQYLENKRWTTWWEPEFAKPASFSDENPLSRETFFALVENISSLGISKLQLSLIFIES